MHVLKALVRHAGTPFLIVFQMATVLAIVVNCAVVIEVAVAAAGERVGIDEDGLGIIQSIGVIGATSHGTQANNLVALSQVDGIMHASFGHVPLMGNNHVDLSREGASVSTVPVVVYRGAEDYQATLGVELIEGDGLTKAILPPAVADEPEWPAIISRSLRIRLFGDGEAVGKILQAGAQRFRVAGVMTDVASKLPASESDRLTMLIAKRAAARNIGGTYLVRTRPGAIDRVLPMAAAMMRTLNPGHVQPLVSTFRDIRLRNSAKANALAWKLAVVVLILVLITAFGVGSLTSHWVRLRRSSIAIRRALGARSSDILLFFLVENAVLSGSGALLGALGTLVVNRLGMADFGLPPVSPSLLLVSITAMMATSLGCALYPAWSASRVHPAEAARSR